MDTKLQTNMGLKTTEEILYLLQNGTTREEKYHLWKVLVSWRCFAKMEQAARWALENPRLCWMKQVQEAKAWLARI
ncbi:hypothetical protein L0Y69_02350 [bacterium]|nr:hypothetical protein [bacterium]